MSSRPSVTIQVTLHLERVDHSHMPTYQEAWEMVEDSLDTTFVDYKGDYTYKAQVVAVEVKG